MITLEKTEALLKHTNVLQQLLFEVGKEYCAREHCGGVPYAYALCLLLGHQATNGIENNPEEQEVRVETYIRWIRQAISGEIFKVKMQ